MCLRDCTILLLGEDCDGGDGGRISPEYPSPILHAPRDNISCKGKSLTPIYCWLLLQCCGSLASLASWCPGNVLLPRVGESYVSTEYGRGHNYSGVIRARDWPCGMCCPWVRGGWDLMLCESSGAAIVVAVVLAWLFHNMAGS